MGRSLAVLKTSRAVLRSGHAAEVEWHMPADQPEESLESLHGPLDVSS